MSEETILTAGGVLPVQHTRTNIHTGAPCPPHKLPQLTPCTHLTIPLPTQHTAINACIHPTTPLSILLSMSAYTLPPHHPTQHTAIDVCTHPTTPLSILLSMSAYTLPPHSAYCYRCLHTPYHPTQHTAIDVCMHPTTPLSILLSMTAHTLPPHSAYCYR